VLIVHIGRPVLKIQLICFFLFLENMGKKRKGSSPTDDGSDIKRVSAMINICIFIMSLMVLKS